MSDHALPVTPAITVVAAIIRGSDGRICLSKRPDHKHQGGHWEFPGGKVEPGEPLNDALARELDEELGMAGAVSSPFMTIAHQYDDLHVTLHFRDVTEWQGEPAGREGQEVAWFEVARLPTLSFPAANRPVVTAMTLPEYVVIAPEELDMPALRAGIEALSGRGYGLYLRQWSDHPELAAILAHCRASGIKVWLRASSEALVATAEEAGVFGIHLPEPVLANATHKPSFSGVISAACHSPEALEKAVALSLDMALVSPVHATESHPGREPLGWPLAGEWITGLPVACYALGGVSPAELAIAREHGAVGVAGIRAFWPESLA
ncbi:MAG: Nudix family hydrolase [Pseudomonadota bacterium]|nr:Nudix family hydrolase [Pseudomonadota bacterium]